ncbi:MAG: MaoC/PaaZ C-terminal domain-containing protein [Dehalococcoidales bacterium]|nr:MaoC/PaaZ C-terminal domain-containing protein [Dehalococcoidales bacterium]MDZ4230374.1 MaoC/PaaZ C-terminal domain-containing protein [Dehalococcoidales bacterium]
MPKYWEDYQVGEKFVTPARTVSEGMIDVVTGLGGLTAPLFWDEEKAKKGVFKTRIAPAVVTLLVMSGLNEQSDFLDPETLIALIGMNNVKIITPVKAGDTLRVEGELIEKKETKNPERGILVERHVCKNQRGEVVIETDKIRLIKRK